MVIITILHMVALSDRYHFGKLWGAKIIAHNFGPCQEIYFILFCLLARKQHFLGYNHCMTPKIATLEKVTDHLWGELCESYPKLVRYNPPKIVLNNRLWRTAGRCWQIENQIDLATKFFARNSVEMFRVILPHEIAHSADFILFGESEKRCGHGKNWCKIMEKLGLPADKYHSLEI